MMNDDISSVHLTMYDIDEDGPPKALSPHAARQQYPDYREEDTVSVSGPIGESKARGLAFPDYKSAKEYWVSQYQSEPIETGWWAERAVVDGKEVFTGAGKYGFKFKKRSA